MSGLRSAGRELGRPGARRLEKIIPDLGVIVTKRSPAIAPSPAIGACAHATSLTLAEKTRRAFSISSSRRRTIKRR